MRYFIELAYKGTDFCGWQIQPEAPSVQEVLEKTLGVLLRQKIDITGSSRTDAGVHAHQQFAHFDTEKPIENPENLTHRVNKILPHSVFVKRIFEVSAQAHSRFDAISRKYEYHISKHRSPFAKDLSYVFKVTLSVEKMNEACQILLQHTDFEAFSKVHTQVNHFRCHIIKAHWEERDDSLIFHIKADRFLRGMVRAIVGTMLEIGLGKLSLSDFEKIIQSKNRSQAGRSVPPEGLFLVEVGYE